MIQSKETSDRIEQKIKMSIKGLSLTQVIQQYLYTFFPPKVNTSVSQQSAGLVAAVPQRIQDVVSWWSITGGSCDVDWCQVRGPISTAHKRAPWAKENTFEEGSLRGVVDRAVPVMWRLRADISRERPTRLLKQ